MLNRRFLLLAVCACLLFQGTAAHADEPLDAAVKRLKTVSLYAFGGVGFAGRTSKGEIDFRYVLRQPAPVALAAFEDVFAGRNVQAKAYALNGIKRLNATRYKDLLARVAASPEKVQVMRGCIMLQEPLSQLAQEIDRAEFGF